jgi:mannose-6-phosphate isomerase-like protein (cupin superfamily)
LFHRISGRNELAGPCNFIDLAEIPPGASIGRHTHEKEEEEFYLVLQGQGRMWQDGEEFAVREGDLVRNPPGGEHGLANNGEGPLRIFVWELEAT